MQVHNLFDITPKGNFTSFEEFYLAERRGNWELDKFIDKKIFEFDSFGRLTSEKSLNPVNSEINSEFNFEYNNGLIIRTIDKSKWGISTKSNTYNESKKLIKAIVKNSSNDDYFHIYEYDKLNRLMKSVTEFRNRTDTYNYEYSLENDIVIKTTKINNVITSVEHVKNGLLIKLINRDNELIEFNYDDKQRLLTENKKDIIRNFKYGNNGFPSEYIGLVSDSDYNKEFYELEFDKFGNWIEIKCYNENENFSKHLKSIRKRIINYT